MTHRREQQVPDSPPRTDPPARKFSFVELLGELFVTVGAVLLLFGFYEAFWTNIQAGQQQNEVEKQLEQTWDSGRDTNPEPGELENRRRFHAPEVGEAFARMYVPVFGADYVFAIVEGTQDDDLLKGPGRYVDSQMPGQPGNFAVAGHRVGKGAPFNDLGNLRACDPIIIETRTDWEIYRVLPIDVDGQAKVDAAAACLSQKQAEELVGGKYGDLTGRHITYPGDIGVTFAVPHKQDTPTDDDEALLTLTTCHPQFSNKQRMIIHAMLERTEKKENGHKPTEMEQS
ncbi:class E sortase [Corynebacterium mendelii]|uniref:Class E sortase n=1 Tax=Corynebacterium mendelii TaxID=2765362 RepID=A0A939IUV1_9CORY|nr:class E sortase [Corynebacterium mendelii]MBN9645334.1 class E sortase [Corynebacterium mendelii]